MLFPAETVNIFKTQPELLVEANAVIFEEGQPGNTMYGIIEGEVEFKVNGRVIETLKQGDIFGEGALVHPEGTRASTAIAKTNCKLAVINQDRFLFAVQQTPLFALQLLRSYSDRLRRLKRSL